MNTGLLFLLSNSRRNSGNAAQNTRGRDTTYRDNGYIPERPRRYYPEDAYYPHMDDDMDYHSGSYPENRTGRTRRTIGFDTGSAQMAMNGFGGNSMPSRKSESGRTTNFNIIRNDHNMRGFDEPMSREEAQEWTQGMRNCDGTSGPHWTLEQTGQVMSKEGIKCDPVEFYIAMNMMYSDYCAAATKSGVNNPEFFARLAHAFLKDEDAKDDKLRRYYECIVEK